MEPLVSVIMANYNTKTEYLEQAINSMLNQTYKNIELIIVDDASEVPPDELIERINDGRIIYLHNEENVGLAVSLNKALKHAKGKYIMRMDTDDISVKYRVEKQVHYMESNPGCDIAGTRTFIQFEDGTFQKGSTFYGKDEAVTVELLFDCVLFHPTVIMRYSFLKENNLEYNPQRRRTQDYDLWVRSVLNNGNIHVMKDALLIKREHAGQASQKARSNQLGVASELHGLLLNRLAGEERVAEEEYQLHEYLCYPLDYNYNSEAVDSVVGWVNKLMELNSRSLVYNKRILKKALFKHMYFSLYIQYRKKNIKLADMMKKQVLLPTNLVVLIATLWTKGIRVLSFSKCDGV